YTERYLGHPDEQPEAYEKSSLFGDAGKLERPLLLIHGLADDNVVAAHTLRLSSALLAAGRPHTVLPLSGVTHMTPQEVVAENLRRLPVDFLQKPLHLACPPTISPGRARDQLGAPLIRRVRRRSAGHAGDQAGVSVIRRGRRLRWRRRRSSASRASSARGRRRSRPRPPARRGSPAR